MSLRVWASPPVLIGQAYVAKAEQYCTGGSVNFFPSKLDGTPSSTWVLTIGRAPDWTAASADPALVDVFSGDLPATINTADDFKAFIRTRTVGDVPLARRNAITAQLDTLGISHSDFILATPLWKVFQRIKDTLLDRDANIDVGFEF